MENFIGYGYDVHRLTKGRKLILGSVDIPFEYGIEGHSDGDVLIHALMDALLGASSLGDIGEHFPVDDPQYENVSSLILLDKVRELIEKHKFTIGNIDIVVVAEKPKLLNYKSLMRKNIAETLGIDVERINIKATTTEGLGFIGRGEGISAHAVVNLLRED
jgi:2-C-methyl-D-erythritol 2,4-cyclodiphosphate synthase